MKDRKIYCLNNIAKIGTDGFRSGYTLIDSIDDAAGVLVRSADMKEMSFPAGLRAIARAGAGVNNIPLERCAEEGIVVFNTPGANANSVKELVLCGMLLASRDIAGGISWVRENAEDEAIAKTTEKAKKDLTDFMNERWKGMYPLAWGQTLREAEYTQWVYNYVLGLKGE